MRPSFEYAEKIIRGNQGVIKTGDAKKKGIDPKTLRQMRDAGILVHENRGIFRLANLPPMTNPDLVQVTLRIPFAVVCLMSALAFHELTTQIPYKIYIAVPRGNKVPDIDYPPIDVTTVSGKSYSTGIGIHHIDGVNVSIYGKEKTIADCFKFRNKIGLDIAIEALKDYFQQPGPNVQKLMEYAEINRVGKIIRPYIEAML